MDTKPPQSPDEPSGSDDETKQGASPPEPDDETRQGAVPPEPGTPPPPSLEKSPDPPPPSGSGVPGPPPPPGLPPQGPPPPGGPPPFSPAAGQARPGGFGPPPIDKKQVKPSLWWLFLPGSLLVLGVIVGIVVFIIGVASAISSIDDDLTEFRAPGSASVQADNNEEFTIFAERGLSSDDFTTSGISSGNVDCAIVGASTGTRIVPDREDFDFDLTLNGTDYRAIFSFTAPEADSYRITCRSASSTPQDLAVSPSIDFAGFVLGTIGIFAFPALGLLLAVIALIVILVRRSRSKKRLEQAAMAGGGSGGLPG